MKAHNKLNSRPEHIRESTTREKVLKNIRHALIETSENPFPDVDFDSDIYKPMTEEADINFALEFTRVGGKFIFCDSAPDMLLKVKGLFTDRGWVAAWCNEESLTGLLNHAAIPVKRLNQGIEAMKVAVTSCEFLIARLGSIMMSSQQYSGRRLYSYPEIHIVIAFTSQIVPDIKQALSGIREKYAGKMPSMVSLVTGPSRTADIEKTLVMGAHGPKELFVFLADDIN
ncbi:MAG: lactate utilization protein [Bacteroidota bacterium]